MRLPACTALLYLLYAAPAAAERIAIVDVTLISGTGAAPLRGATVVVDGERITAVGPAAAVRVPADARRVDGRGKFLIPGLVDMHTHVSKTRGSALQLFVAHGVTTLRDMGGDQEELLRWRREIAAGSRIGPRLLLAGPYLESARNVERMRRTPVSEMAEPVERTRIPVGSPDDAGRVVTAIAQAGLDHVKIRTVQDRATYLAIAEAARKARLPLVGHPPSLPPEDILTAGQKSLEHGLVVPPASPEREQRLAVYRRFADAGIAVVPTLITAFASVFPPQETLAAMVEDDAGKIEPRRRYVSKFLLIDWREQVPEQTPERRAFFRELKPRGLQVLREMHEAGVKILPGSDTGVLGVFPGSSLHEELALFVSELGLTPAQALERATRSSAEFLGLGASLGTIAQGKLADLVLLGADPLADLGNLRSVDAVVMRGRLFTRADVDMLLAAVEAAPDRQANDWPRE